MYTTEISLLLLTVIVSVLSASDMYTTQYDSIKVDEVLTNDRLYSKYFNCLKGTGKCTPEGHELKTHMKEALQTKCSKCSEKQKIGMEKIFQYIIKNKPDDFLELEKMFDPELKFRELYKDEAKKLGIVFP